MKLTKKQLRQCARYVREHSNGITVVVQGAGYNEVQEKPHCECNDVLGAFIKGICDTKMEQEDKAKYTSSKTFSASRTAKLSPPWWIYHTMLMEFFRDDKGIAVSPMAETRSGYAITFTGKNSARLGALKGLLEDIDFGGVKLAFNFPDDTKVPELSIIEMYACAFNGNPNFRTIVKVVDAGFAPRNGYVVMNPIVHQFFADDLTDPHGNQTCLAEDLARMLFKKGNVNFCTTDGTEPPVD